MNHSDQNMREDSPELLTRQLHLPLPGGRRPAKNAAQLSFGRHAGPVKPDARPAAVVVLLHQVDNQWLFVPLMLRPKSLWHHAGQISLPGGVIEAGESSERGTLRELEEELGIDRFRSLLLGQLSPLYLFGNFLITPWVAVVRSEVEFRRTDSEVEEVLQVPLPHLLSPTGRGQHVQQRGDAAIYGPAFFVAGASHLGAPPA